jgi:YbbR domain-containing protein
MLFDNLGLKLLSVLLAVALWVYVLDHENPTVKRRVTVPVAAVGVAVARVQVMDITPDTVDVVLKGRQSALDEAHIELIRATANVANRDFGEYDVPLDIIGTAPGVTIEHVSVSSARVRLDAVVAKTRPVMVETRGNPADGFGTVELSVKPNEVQVRGPGAWVQRVVRVVAAVDISGQAATVQQIVPLEARDQSNVRIAGLRFEPDKVEVTVQIHQIETHTVPVKPILSSPGAGYAVTQVSVDPTTVTLAGKLIPKAIETSRIDISALRGTGTYSVPLQVPEGSNVLGGSSARVTVTVSPASSSGGSAAGEKGEPEPTTPSGAGAAAGGGVGAPEGSAPKGSEVSGGTGARGEPQRSGQEAKPGGVGNPAR